jgi:hypothetical protein
VCGEGSVGGCSVLERVWCGEMECEIDIGFKSGGAERGIEGGG